MCENPAELDESGAPDMKISTGLLGREAGPHRIRWSKNTGKENSRALPYSSCFSLRVFSIRGFGTMLRETTETAGHHLRILGWKSLRQLAGPRRPAENLWTGAWTAC